MTLSKHHYSAPSIVLIESNHELRVSLVEIFEFEGYSAASVSTLREGIALLTSLETSPRLVICELFREGMSAARILESISAFVDDNTSFLFLTTHKQVELPPNPSHRVFHLQLPFQVIDLLGIVQRVFER